MILDENTAIVLAAKRAETIRPACLSEGYKTSQRRIHTEMLASLQPLRNQVSASCPSPSPQPPLLEPPKPPRPTPSATDNISSSYPPHHRRSAALLPEGKTASPYSASREPGVCRFGSDPLNLWPHVHRSRFYTREARPEEYRGSYGKEQSQAHRLRLHTENC